MAQGNSSRTKFTSSVLISRLDVLRREVGLDDGMFLIAVMTSENMTRRNVILAYRTAKRTIPNLKETEYLTIAIVDRSHEKVSSASF